MAGGEMGGKRLLLKSLCCSRSYFHTEIKATLLKFVFAGNYSTLPLLLLSCRDPSPGRGMDPKLDGLGCPRLPGLLSPRTGNIWSSETGLGLPGVVCAS